MTTCEADAYQWDPALLGPLCPLVGRKFTKATAEAVYKLLWLVRASMRRHMGVVIGSTPQVTGAKFRPSPRADALSICGTHVLYCQCHLSTWCSVNPRGYTPGCGRCPIPVRTLNATPPLVAPHMTHWLCSWTVSDV